ncbi:hypothetical protein ABT147_00715 [Streptomyces sp. NPDC001868]|uniref:hypothetical protein n=1 Tax=Streptomyces sp. NPDC001868 TaxID=3154401 RepID=UPI00331A0D76
MTLGPPSRPQQEGADRYFPLGALAPVGGPYNLFDGHHTSGQIVSELPAASKDLFTEDFLNKIRKPDGVLKDRLRPMDHTGDWRPNVPGDLPGPGRQGRRPQSRDVLRRPVDVHPHTSPHPRGLLYALVKTRNPVVQKRFAATDQ